MTEASSPPHCLYLTPSQELKLNLTPDELRDILDSGEGLLWYRVTEDDDTSRLTLRNLFGFHELAIEDCFNGRIDTPKIDDYGRYLFIVAQSVDYEQAQERLDLDELDMFLGPNFVVTVHAASEMQLVDRLFRDASANPHLLGRGADFLAHNILDVMVDELLPAVEAMDEQLDDLEQLILQRPERHLLTSLLRLKRQTLLLRRSIQPQRDMVNRLSRGEFAALIRPEALIFFRDIYDHIVRTESLLDGLRDIADGTLSSYLSVVNNRMNEVMKAMSVVAVIFLPLTLIASIYGTNLDLSPFGLTFHYGFVLMLASMVLITAVMVYFFRRHGWF